MWADGKRVGPQPHSHFEINPHRPFHLLADAAPEFMLTYDHAPEIEDLVCRHEFHAVQMTTRDTHHDRKGELVMTNGYTWPMTAERFTIWSESRCAWIDGRG